VYFISVVAELSVSVQLVAWKDQNDRLRVIRDDSDSAHSFACGIPSPLTCHVSNDCRRM